MKKFKNLVLFLAAATIALGASAQNATTTQAKPAAAASADKVDASSKGPKGETVYIGPNGGHYYKDATGKKVYMKPATGTATNVKESVPAKPAAPQAKATTTEKAAPAASAAQTKAAVTTSKPADAVNTSLKGPKGETVYTGPKGGNYYLDKNGNKVYLKK